MKILGYLSHFGTIADGYAVFEEIGRSQRHSGFRIGMRDIRGSGFVGAVSDEVLRRTTFVQPMRKDQDISTGKQSDKAGRR